MPSRCSSSSLQPTTSLWTHCSYAGPVNFVLVFFPPGDASIFKLFHLRLEIGRRDLGARIANFVDQPMITKDDCLGRLIDNGFGNFRRGRGTSNTRSWAAASRRWR